MADQAEHVEELETEQPDSVGDDLRDVINRLEADVAEDEEHEEQAAAPEKAEKEVPAEEAKEESEPVSESVEKPKQQYKPPIDWGPKLKQEFKNLPADVQKAIYEREQSVNNVFQQTAQERRTAQEFNRITTEFAGLMAAEGVQDPMQGVRGLLATTAQLAMGNQQMKAAKIAQLIRHYGVDIETLDAALVGEQPKAQPQPQQMADPRLDYVFNRLQQAERQQQEQLTTKAHQTIHEFGADPENEFFEDVRESMADFLEVAAQHGQTMTLKQAYDRACAMNPEVASIIAQRRTQQSGATAGQRMAHKANAASSISGRSGGMTQGGVSEGGSIREILEAQFSDQGRV